MNFNITDKVHPQLHFVPENPSEPYITTDFEKWRTCIAIMETACRHLGLFSSTCGQHVRADTLNREKHQKACKTEFKPLQVGDLIPNNMASAYKDLHAMFTVNGPRENKKWVPLIHHRQLTQT